jgi:hypothetical protein
MLNDSFAEIPNWFGWNISDIRIDKECLKVAVLLPNNDLTILTSPSNASMNNKTRNDYGRCEVISVRLRVFDDDPGKVSFE